MAQRPGAFEERVIGILPKNNVTEQRFILKAVTVRGAKDKDPKPFLDIREYWFVNGPGEEPIPTKRGTMIHRERLGKAITMICGGVQPGELSDESAEIMSAVRYATGDSDPVMTVMRMLKSMSRDQVEEVITQATQEGS